MEDNNKELEKELNQASSRASDAQRLVRDKDQQIKELNDEIEELKSKPQRLSNAELLKEIGRIEDPAELQKLVLDSSMLLNQKLMP